LGSQHGPGEPAALSSGQWLQPTIALLSWLAFAVCKFNGGQIFSYGINTVFDNTVDGTPTAVIGKQ
jgi:hypothetical protein